MADRIPYTPFPTVQPQAAPPEDYERIATSPNQFGAQVGQGMQELGAQGLKAADFYNQAAADDQMNKWQTAAENLLHGTGQVGPDGQVDRGYLGLTGSAAMDARQGLTQKFNQLREQFKQGLSSPESQLRFEEYTRRYQSLLMSRADSHYEQEAKTWGVSVNDTTLANGDRSIANSYTDDEHFKHLMQDQRDAAVKKAQILGQDPKGAEAEADNRSIMARLNGAIAANDVTAAQNIFQQYGSQLDDKTRLQYANHLKGRADAALGDEALAEARGQAASGGGLSMGGAVPQRIAAVAQQNGDIDPTTALATAQIESSMGHNLGSRGNIFQLGQTEWHSVGGGQMGDTDTDIKNGVAFLAEKKKELAAALGRDPQPWEVYLAHQQGTGGALSLLNNPDKPAGSLVGNAAIRQNGGDPSAPASQFVAKWRDTFNRTAASLGGASSIPGPGIGLALGDSIAVQQIRHGVVGGEDAPNTGQPLASGKTAGVGDTPDRVLHRLQSVDPQTLTGKTVFLSTGASNDPSKVGLAADQIEALHKAGAASIVIPGVGPGVKNADQVNAELSNIAQAHGAVFFQPQVQWQKDGIHPAQVDAVRQQAEQALATKGVPDRVVGQAATGATPPPSAPPGMADLANAESELAQNHARTLVNLGNNPRLAGNPAALDHALKQEDIQFHSHQMAITAQKQAITAARDAAADGYVQRMMKGEIGPDIVQQIAADPHLDRATRENLWTLQAAHARQTVDGDAAKYGSKFFDYYQRITARDNDPNKIRDPSQIYALAVPKPDGSQDLTLAGVDKLVSELRTSGAPDKVGEIKMREGALAYAKHQLSFEADYGMFKIPDPKGMDAFNTGFLPAFFQAYDQGVAAGKTPAEILKKDNLDAIIAPFKRSPAEMAADRLAAGTDAGGTQANKAAPAGPPVAAIEYLRTHPDLRGAFDQKYGAGAAGRVLGASANPLDALGHP